MDDLDILRRDLRRALAGRPKAAQALFPATAHARLLAAIRDIGPARGHRHTPHIARGVMAFRMARRDTPYPDLKYACHGIARQVDWEGRRLIDDPRMVADLLAAVAALPAEPQTPYRRDCCRALLAARQNAALEDASPDAERWRPVDDFLRAQDLPPAAAASIFG